MPKNKKLIETHFDSLVVRVKPGYVGRRAAVEIVFDTASLDSEAGYRVLATYMHHFQDGSSCPAWLLMGPDDEVIERVCTLFEVVEIDGRLTWAAGG